MVQNFKRIVFGFLSLKVCVHLCLLIRLSGGNGVGVINCISVGGVALGDERVQTQPSPEEVNGIELLGIDTWESLKLKMIVHIDPSLVETSI